MTIKILYDNTALAGYKADWGFSCLIADSILFDAGKNSDVLATNIKKMGIDVKKIKTVILSHKHFDHIGGLTGLLALDNNVETIYCTPDAEEQVKNIIPDKSDIEVKSQHSFGEINEFIYTSGAIDCIYKDYSLQEHALIIEHKDKIGIITGCAHPGIIYIVKHVQKKMPYKEISFVIGGFHTADFNNDLLKNIAKDLQELEVHKAGPCHCSGNNTKKVFKNKFGKNYIKVDAGAVLELDKLFGE